MIKWKERCGEEERCITIRVEFSSLNSLPESFPFFRLLVSSLPSSPHSSSGMPVNTARRQQSWIHVPSHANVYEAHTILHILRILTVFKRLWKRYDDECTSGERLRGKPAGTSSSFARLIFVEQAFVLFGASSRQWRKVSTAIRVIPTNQSIPSGLLPALYPLSVLLTWPRG